MTLLHVETPCLPSRSLSRASSRDVYLKLENCQPTGSFKIRGIGALCAEAAKNGVKSFVSSSGGNAGLAAAFAGAELGIPTKVFVPSSTPAFMRERIFNEGAEVITHGNIWDEANAAALEEVKRTQACYVSPFDHPSIWQGNSTLIDEIKTQLGKPGLILSAVGGGGLLLGVLEGLKRQGWEDVPVIACETEGMASFSATFKAKKLVTLPTVSGIATSLGARTVSAGLLPWIQSQALRSSVVSDRVAAQAVFRFLDDHRFVVEPACGAALAPVYAGDLEEVRGPVVVIVCGGAVVNRSKLEEWQEVFA